MKARRNEFDELLDRIAVEAKSQDGGLEELEALSQYYSVFNQFLELRKKRGMTQVELAKASGIDQGEISRIEKGIANPTLATLQSLLQALGGRLQVVLQEPELAPA